MLHWADYVIFVGFLLLSMSIGVYHGCTGGKQSTTQEFLLANRQLSVIPTTLSILVSWLSAIMILGKTAEMYSYGTLAWLWESMAYILGILIAERLYVPWMYPLKLTSINEYLEIRFKSKAIRIFGSILGSFTGLLYMGVAIYAPSVAMEAATGFPTKASMPIMAAVCVIYTAVGGMRAVIWTDVFQFVVMLGGMLAILIKGNLLVGGFGRALEIAEKENRLIWTDVSVDPTVRHTVWGFLLGLSIGWSKAYGINQASLQRYASVGSLVKARLVLLLNLPLLILMTSISFMTGVIVLAYYSEKGCDPLYGGKIRHPNQMLSLFVREVFKENTGFSGLFLATLFSGALSSVSSSLTGVVAMTWEDILRPWLGHWPERRAAVLTRILVAVFGTVACGLSFMCAYVPGPVTQVSIALLGAVSGPILGMYLMGGIFRWAEWKGGFIGGAVSFVLLFWITAGSIASAIRHPTLPPISMTNCTPAIYVTLSVFKPVYGLPRMYSISYLWYVPLGILVVFAVAVPISLGILWCCPSDEQKKRDAIPDNLFVPFKQICSFYPPAEEPSVEEMSMDKKETYANPAFSSDSGPEKNGTSDGTTRARQVSREVVPNTRL